MNCPGCYIAAHHPEGELDSHRLAFLVAIADCIVFGGIQSMVDSLCAICQAACRSAVEQIADATERRAHQRSLS